MYIAEAKCLSAWQRWQTPNKRVDSGDIKGRQKKEKIHSVSNNEVRRV